MVANMAGRGLRAGTIEIVLRRPAKRRSLDQNRKLWPMLADISEQIEWPINGRMDYLPAEDWKDILTAGLDSEQRVAQGINGGFVMLGRRTSKMRKKEFAELIELIYAFGAERGVAWSEPAMRAYEQYREAA
ncbi:recombination protein NinB [Salinicola halophilus]|uniref:recombination protein NinB n=1 Tax=Salinicola halophilus TaxID=184065 RepID=UPI000DA162DB|nr:recombination protein NinB [Salinicola halophilus]